MKNKAIFLDKDGTLVKNVPYNIELGKIRLYSDVPEALLLFKKNNFKIIIITNQPGVAYGYFEESALQRVKNEFDYIFKSFGINLDGFYYCPHHTEGKISKYNFDCLCRKPQPGMIMQAAKDLNIDLSRSWMIGDILNDVEAGNRAGCKTILINNGNETEWIKNKLRKPKYIVNKMEEAAFKIIAFDKNEDSNREKRGQHERSGKKNNKGF